MRIFLVRHGESTSDVEDRYGGDYDDHLTGKGKSQTEKLCERLSPNGIEIVFSSPKARAREGAEILKGCLGCGLEIVENLKERNRYGILTGMKKSEARKKYPEQVGLLENHLTNLEGGENYSHFKGRVLRAFDEIADSDYGNVVIVTHGGPIGCIVREVLRLGEFRSLDACAVIELKILGGKASLVRMENARLEQ